MQTLHHLAIERDGATRGILRLFERGDDRARTFDLLGESGSGDGVSGPVGSRAAALGIRPTDLLVGAEKELTLEGEVFLVEPIGPISYVDVDVDGIAVKGVCDPDAAPAVGERVRLGCSTARVHLFDRASSQRI